MTCRQTTQVVGSSIDLCTYKKGWLLPVCTTYPSQRPNPPRSKPTSLRSPKKQTKQNETKTKMPSSIMLKLLLSSLIAAVSARQICGTCYNAGNKPIFAGSATGGEWKCDAYCDQNMVNAANEVCCVRIVFFSLALMNHKMSRRWRHPLLFSIVYRSANGLLLGGHLHGVKVLSTFLRLDWRIVIAWGEFLSG